MTVGETRGLAIRRFLQAQSDIVIKVVCKQTHVHDQWVRWQTLNAQDVSIRGAKPGRERTTIAPDDGRGDSRVAGWEVPSIGIPTKVTINVVPILPIGCRSRGVQVHATLHDVVVTCHKAVKHHGAIGIGRLRRRLVVVSANKVGVTRGPRETVCGIKVSQIGEHGIVLTTCIVADE